MRTFDQHFRSNSPPSFPLSFVKPEAGGNADWLSKWEVFQHFDNFAKLEMFFYLLLKIPHIYWLGVKKRSSSPFLDSHVFIFKTIMRQWHLVVGTPSLDCLFPHNTLSPFHFTSIPSWNCYNHLLLFKLFFFIADLSIVSIFSTVCFDFQQQQDELRCWSASLFPTASAALPSIPVCRSPSLQ